jgi:hypothetical protein
MVNGKSEVNLYTIGIEAKDYNCAMYFIGFCHKNDTYFLTKYCRAGYS